MIMFWKRLYMIFLLMSRKGNTLFLILRVCIAIFYCFMQISLFLQDYAAKTETFFAK